MNIYGKNGTKIAIVLAALLAAGLILGSCANALGPENTPVLESATQFPAQGMGRLQISLELPSDTDLPSRTIFPENQFTRYELSFAETGGPGAYTHGDEELTSARASVDLPPGTWTITVKAYAGAERDILSGTGTATNVVVSAGSAASAPITLGRYTESAVSGKLSWNITLPSGGTYADNTLTALAKDGNNLTAGLFADPINLSDQSSLLDLDGKEIAPGEYLVKLSIKSAAGPVATWLESVHIYPGQTTHISPIFSAEAFSVQVPVYGVVTSTGSLSFTSKTVEAFSEADYTARNFNAPLDVSVVDAQGYVLFIPATVPKVYLRLTALVDSKIIYKVYPDALLVGAAAGPRNKPLPAAAYGITTNTPENGTITAPSAAFEGEPVAVTVEPDPNYLLQGGSLTYNSTAFTDTFTMPGEAITITATFLSSSGMAASVNGAAYDTLSKAFDAVNRAETGSLLAGTQSKPVVITLLKNADIGAAANCITLDTGRYVQLISNNSSGLTIKLTTNDVGSIFTVATGAGLTLGDGINPLTLDGGAASTPICTNTDALVTVTGSLTIKAGAIVQNNRNTTATTSAYGGGVRVNGTGTMLLEGTIKQNSSDSGGGIYLDAGSALTIQGSAQVFSNNEVYLAATSAKISMGDSLTQAAVAVIKPAVYADWETTPLITGDVNLFADHYTQFTVSPEPSHNWKISPNATPVGALMDAQFIVTYNTRLIGYYKTLATALSGITAAGSAGSINEPIIITMYTNTSLASDGDAMTISGDSFIQLIPGNQDGVTISRAYSSSTKPVFTVAAGSRLTLGVDGGTIPLIIDGTSKTTTAALIGVVGTLIMNGGTIRGNTGSTTANGGGVYMTNGTFTMNGGTISGNRFNNGGGVYMTSGTFTMNGGTITDNSSNSKGGGVYVAGGIFTMTGGIISGNRSSSDGGGVYVDGGTFTMGVGGETITGNTAYKGGGGVYVTGDKTFTMNGGTITVNNGSDGGGVYASTDFAMNGGIITANDGVSGGGVYTSKSFTLNTGAITGNNGFDGAGVYVNAGDFNIKGGTINRNRADNNGGGVYMSGGNSEMRLGEIRDNTCNNDGGGVFISYGARFSMVTGTFNRNRAGNDGGGVYVAGVFAWDVGQGSGTIAADQIAGRFGKVMYKTQYGTAKYSQVLDIPLEGINTPDKYRDFVLPPV
ncbi:probable extracellular nuclease [Treponema primitia ZAS-2]|uniref:Probable extracellular nuclease n=1 Tax=Treponema primitia (strain ATCC BAA-887 / DSM 12427 / ZAS-2) TaxID=545694 RepID=F5YQ04_TREPZ|nr:nuclease [Treponema primitia]AEF86336.1 probable extracellular nuclease [Treponema primitia ZAS-2]